MKEIICYTYIIHINGLRYVYRNINYVRGHRVINVKS